MNDTIVACAAAQLQCLSQFFLDNETACRPSDPVIGEALYGIALLLEQTKGVCHE